MTYRPALAAEAVIDPASSLLARPDRRLLSLQCRRRLGDGQPYRAVDPDGDVSVPDPGDRACRFSRFQESGRRGGAPGGRRLAARGRRADRRPWWLLRLESIAYVLVSALCMLALAFLVVLGPLVFRATLAYAPKVADFEAHYNIARLVIAAVVIALALFILHLWLPAGRRRLREVWP